MGKENREYVELKVRFGMPDGNLADESIVGRDGLVDSLWKKAEAGSLRLLSERRMGKTWLLKLAVGRRPDWALPMFFDLEQVHSAPEFVWRLNRGLREVDLVSEGWWSDIEAWFRRIYQQMQGKKVGPVEMPELDSWGSLLEDTCSRFAAKCGERRGILLFDELPFFLDNLIKNGNEVHAKEVLDKLRALRYEHPALRMIFCGSLGLHIVLARLNESGYTGQPVNDMPPFEVPPLEFEEACFLSGCLLSGERIPCSDLDGVAESIATESCGVPFYIQHMVSWMADSTVESWTAEHVAGVLDELFSAHGDPAEFSYYDRRLDQYYLAGVVDVARPTLDILSRSTEGLLLDELVNLLRHRPKTLPLDPEELLKPLRTLQNDHYLIRKDDRWRFKLEVVRKWWWEARGRLPL